MLNFVILLLCVCVCWEQNVGVSGCRFICAGILQFQKYLPNQKSTTEIAKMYNMALLGTTAPNKARYKKYKP